MSINWVMLSEDKKAFTPLPGEQQLYISPIRTAISIHSLNKSASTGDQFTKDSGSGTCFLTNRRIVYLPSVSSSTFESFAAPILNCHDAHVNAPFFGPNVWTAIVQPVPGGNIPPSVPAIEVKMTFKEGGAFDFHSTYERIKERLHQAVEVARESGHLSDERDGDVNLDGVHLDELPAYEDASAPLVSNRQAQAPPLRQPERPREIPPDDDPPSEPPRYEDVQRDSVADELERQLRGSPQ